MPTSLLGCGGQRCPARLRRVEHHRGVHGHACLTLRSNTPGVCWNMADHHDASWRTAITATLHCLTGCAIGEVLGMVLGTAFGWGNAGTIVLSIVLAFVFGYSLTMRPVLGAGVALGAAIPIALASDTVSIARDGADRQRVRPGHPRRDRRGPHLGAVLGQPRRVAGARLPGDGAGEPLDDQPWQRPRSRARVPRNTKVPAWPTSWSTTRCPGIATITLDSPHNRNALSAQLRRELKAHLATAVEDDAARVIVLTHTGTVFCAGMDLKEAGSAGTESRGRPGVPRHPRTALDQPEPVVARLSGPARAGGVGMVAAADIAVAAETATFAFTEVRIGVVPAVISVTVLPRLLPRAAHELFLTGETFDGTRAAQVGLINSAVPADQLDAEVSATPTCWSPARPARSPPPSRCCAASRPRLMAEDFTAMLELSAKHFASEEGQEGIASFVQKRKANWVPEG